MLRKGRQPWTCFRVSLNNNVIINYKRFILNMTKTSPFIIPIPTGSALDSNMCSVASGIATMKFSYSFPFGMQLSQPDWISIASYNIRYLL